MSAEREVIAMRMQMACAEAGYPEADVVDLGYAYDVPDWLPNEVWWRASEVSGAGLPMCFVCFEGGINYGEPNGDGGPVDCDAVARLTFDCGRVR